MESEDKTKAKSKVLAITDGSNQGSNLVVVNDDLNKAFADEEKRRKNILKSRELRKRSAQGRRDSVNKGPQGSVFDRLSAAA